MDNIIKLSKLYNEYQKNEKEQLNEIVLCSSNISKYLINDSSNQLSLEKNYFSTLETKLTEIQKMMENTRLEMRKCIIDLHEKDNVDFDKIELLLRKNNCAMFLIANSIEKLNDNALNLPTMYYVVFSMKKLYNNDTDIKNNLNLLKKSSIPTVKNDFILRNMILKQYKKTDYDKLNDY